MMSPSYFYFLIGISSLWALWFIVLGLERKSFHSLWRDWKAMQPSTKAVMLVLCTYCTVTAQKPGNVNSNAPAAPPDSVQQSGGKDDSRQQVPPPPPGGPQNSPPAPARIILQATLSTDSGVTAAFSGEPGWSLPVAVPAAPKLSALSFAGNATNPVSPVRFSNIATGSTIQTLMLVTRGAAADLATLVDAPETARLRLASDNSRQTVPGAAEVSLTQQFIPQQWQLVTLDFEAPATVSEMVFGGTAGRPVWNRGWQGEIAEVVGFDTPPDADVRAGVANYLSIRWKLAPSPASPGQRQAAIDAGLHYGLVWGSVIFLK
jgi:hypothetical protein